MNSFLISLGLIFTLFFTACSSYSITKYFDKDEFYLKALQETKKTDIIVNNEVSSIFTATHLNKVEKKLENSFETFIVSIYQVNKKEESSKLPQFTLNDEKPIEIVPIEQNDKILESLPLKNSWAKYYFVSFNKNEELNSLKLKFKNQDNLEAELNF